MTQGAREPDDQPTAPRRSTHRWIVVALGIAILAFVGIEWIMRREAVCSEDERSALLAVQAFGGGHPSVVESGPADQPSTAGCAVSFTAPASAKEVARYYADRLDALGWTPQLGGWVVPIEGDPFRYLVGSDLADLEAHPDWKDLHYGITVTELGPDRARIDVSVRRYVVTIF
jgi:hypothetical protein